jgi:hypothetical protein
MMLRLDEDGWRAINQANAGSALDEDAIAMATRMVDTLEEMGIPLLDNIRDLPLNGDPTTRLEQAKQAFEGLPSGITHFIIHPSKDTPELRAITSDWPCRVADYQTFLRNDLKDYIRNIGVHIIGYRGLKDLMPG